METPVTTERELREVLGEPGDVASRAAISQALERRDDSLADVERHYGPAYADGLYRA